MFVVKPDSVVLGAGQCDDCFCADPRRIAVRGPGPGGDAGRSARRSATSGGELRLDDLVAHAAGPRPACDGRGKGRSRYPRPQDARQHDLRKNTDPTLQATHTIDLKFSFADGAPITGFKDVGLPQMRKEDSTAAGALASVKVKISDTYFLIALAKGEADTARNLDLMQTRPWFDFPLLLNDGRIAKVVFQKSPEGRAMLDKAFEAWRVEAPPSPAALPSSTSLPAKQAPPEPPVLDSGATVVPMVSEGGTFVVPVRINDQITLNFVVDSGASDVAVPADVVSTLVRTGTITDADFLGKQTYRLADGSTVPSQRFVIRSLKIGDKTLKNVVGSISPRASDLLLGQSFLNRFQSWSIDNQRRALILNVLMAGGADQDQSAH
jgi:clan AA aspartic protease (TIGR02281 family)